MYRRKRDLHCEYLPGPSIGRRSFEPAAMILLAVDYCEDVLTGVDMMNEWMLTMKISRRYNGRSTYYELLCAPTEGYAKAIVVPPILAEHFELKHSLINMMTSDQFFELEKDNPHDHICWPNKITSTIKYKDVPNSAIKLMLFPFSLAGAARRWLKKEPPRSILTWEDLVSKFINESSSSEQQISETKFPTFNNVLMNHDQDSLNSTAGGNLLERRTQDVLTIIENKSKVRNSRNKSIVSQVKSSDVNSSSSSEIAKLTHAVNQQTSAVTTAMTAIHSRNKKPTRRTVPLKKTTSNALVSQCDGFGYDWSDQAEEGPTSFALMAYSSTSLTSSTNSKSVYEEDIKLLKREVYLRDLDITELKRNLELVTKEKDEVQLKVQKLENSSKSLSELLDRHIMDNLDDCVEVNKSASESVVEKLTVETNKPKTARKEDGALIIEDWVSEREEEDVPKIKIVEMFNKPSFAKINFVKSTKQVKSPRNISVDKNRQNTPNPRGNKRNWNRQMSQKLGNDFEMFNKACHVCGSLEHLRKECNNWYNNQRSDPISLNAARPVNVVQPRIEVNNAGPMKNVINDAYSTARRPFN
ncbi:hypothetical protein Tco_0512306 [Tanacetum coccineum]